MYLLLNSRFHRPQQYVSEGISGVVQTLEAVMTSATVAGIVYADAMLLTRLARQAPSLAKELEATPSINCGLDSWDKMRQHLEMTVELGFRPPRCIVPDRALNRDLPRLRAFREAQQTELPEAALHLLANEGCLWQCPYRLTHESLLALGRVDATAAAMVDGFEMVKDAACLRRFWEEPWRVLASPFIRPEDADALEGLVDGIKLSGRSRGPVAMKRIVLAYLAGHYAGNLLDLLDTTEALRGRLQVPNRAFPLDFFERVSICNKHCHACGYCKEMARQIQRKPCSLARFAEMDA
ncbi:hypothetical protein [Megalodesulfovibrio paquesii]